MKKKFKIVLAMMLAFVVVFSLAGCGKKEAPAPAATPEPAASAEPEPKPTPTPEIDPEVQSLGSDGIVSVLDLVGSYELKTMAGSENDISDADIELMKSLDLVVALDIYDDGTAYMDVYGEELELSYDADRMVVMMDGRECSFTYNNNLFELVEGESTMTFEKVSNTPKSREPLVLEELVGQYKQKDDKNISLNIYEDAMGTIVFGDEENEDEKEHILSLDLENRKMIMDLEEYDILFDEDHNLIFEGGSDYAGDFKFTKIAETPADDSGEGAETAEGETAETADGEAKTAEGEEKAAETEEKTAEEAPKA